MTKFNDISSAEHLQFLSTFYTFQEAAYDINVANGWWEDRMALIEMARKASSELKKTAEVQVVIACLGLGMTEPAEGIEAVRKHPRDTWGDYRTKDTLVRELAGTVVRCMDLAAHLKLPLAHAIVAELKENSTRGHRHGGKAA